MKDPTAQEMREFLQRQFPGECEPDTSDGMLCFNVEAAIYWFANDWHGGQSSNLYLALSTSDYRPGPCCGGPENESVEADMYAALEAEFAQ